MSFFISTHLYAQVNTFNAPGSYQLTIPSNVFSIVVHSYGAGGGGSKGFSGLKGTGGGGGAFAGGVLNVNPGDIINMVVGAGGTGATISGNGTAGGASIVSFGSNILTANGGAGATSTNAPSGTGGLGGNSSIVGSWTSTVSRCGGSGALLTVPGGTSPGGGAGGAAGFGSNGKNAGGSTTGCGSYGSSQAGGGATGNGGPGGNGGNGNSNGLPGAGYGGGGGGSAGTGIGGNGADGAVIITYNISLPYQSIHFKLIEMQPHKMKLLYRLQHFKSPDSIAIEIVNDDGSVEIKKDNHKKGNSKTYIQEFDYEAVPKLVRLKVCDQEISYYSEYLDVTTITFSNVNSTLFPNPHLSGPLHIFIFEGQNRMVKIYTVEGKEVKTVALSSAENEVNIEEISAGVYVIQILSETGEANTYSFIKQ